MFSKNPHGYRARTYGTREKVNNLSVSSVVTQRCLTPLYKKSLALKWK